MNETFQRIFGVAAIAVIAMSAAIAGDGVRVRANVPFEFTIGDKSVPAGEYIFEETTHPGIMLVQSVADKTTIYAAHSIGGSNKTNVDNAVVFNAYGSQHFLHEVDAFGGSVNAEFPKARAEKEALARHTVKKTVAIVAAR
jgi:hypothetical protein